LIAFVDTTVVLRFVLEGDISLHQAFAATVTACSELLWIESMRVVQRLRLDAALSDQALAEAVGRIATCYASFRVCLLDEEIKQTAAGPFPTVIGILDALHLACARRCVRHYPGETLLLYSYDRQMNLCARALGIATSLAEGPVPPRAGTPWVRRSSARSFPRTRASPWCLSSRGGRHS
jgi:predicted nucleic acid-binding protein